VDGDRAGFALPGLAMAAPSLIVNGGRGVWKGVATAAVETSQGWQEFDYPMVNTSGGTYWVSAPIGHSAPALAWSAAANNSGRMQLAFQGPGHSLHLLYTTAAGLRGDTLTASGDGMYSAPALASWGSGADIHEAVLYQGPRNTLLYAFNRMSDSGAPAPLAVVTIAGRGTTIGG
jgi:hypothetical protein